MQTSSKVAQAHAWHHHMQNTDNDDGSSRSSLTTPTTTQEVLPTHAASSKAQHTAACRQRKSMQCSMRSMSPSLIVSCRIPTTIIYFVLLLLIVMWWHRTFFSITIIIIHLKCGSPDWIMDQCKSETRSLDHHRDPVTGEILPRQWGGKCVGYLAWQNGNE